MTMITKCAASIASLLIATSVMASQAKGDWTDTFQLKKGHFAVHTPSSVCLDGMFTAGNALDIDGLVLNGTTITNFHVKVDSTRDEFVKALKQSNLY